MSSLALLITFSKVLAVGSACGVFEGSIVCWVRPYSFEKYEKALWNAIKSWLQLDNSLRIFKSSKSNSSIYFAAFSS